MLVLSFCILGGIQRNMEHKYNLVHVGGLGEHGLRCSSPYTPFEGWNKGSTVSKPTLPKFKRLLNLS